MSFDPEKLDDLILSEVQRRFEDEADKIPGTALPKLIEFASARLDRRRQAEQQKAEREAQKQARDPIGAILNDGLPDRRKAELLRDLAHSLREELDRAEKAIAGLGE